MQKKSGCVAEYFAFRWISLLVSREFPLPDVIAVWDTLLADPYRFNFLLYLCVAMTMYAYPGSVWAMCVCVRPGLKCKKYRTGWQKHRRLKVDGSTTV